MTNYTPILRLVMPAFDQTPWNDDMNNDLLVIDAAVGKFFGVANLAGVWQNNMTFVVGQVLVDGDDGSMWTCMVAHTSAPPPQTFAAARSQHPDRWISAASTAQEYASQASTFANSALTSANNAASSATAAAGSAAIVAGALPLSGGTMTGNLTLHADPTTALMAATKQYVDARVGGTGFLPTSGGTLTGPLTLSADPTTPLQATTKQYTDRMLPQAGGTITGSLNVGGAITSSQASGIGLAGIVGNGWTANSSVVNFSFAVNWRWQYDRTTGALSYMRGSDSANLFNIDQNGIVTATSEFLSPAFMISSSSARFYSDSVYTYINMGGTGGKFMYDLSGNNLYWAYNTGTIIFDFRNDGFCYAALNSVGGNGAYVNVSDERIKHDIAESPYGMETIVNLHPVSFIRDGKSRTEIGFTAQDVMRVLPEAVTEVSDDLLAVSGESILAVAVHAIQQLDQRLSKLEAR